MSKDGSSSTVLATVINPTWAYHRPIDTVKQDYYVITHVPSGFRLPYPVDSAAMCVDIIELLPNQEEITEEYIKKIKLALVGCRISEYATLV